MTDPTPAPAPLRFADLVAAAGVTDPAGLAQDLSRICGLDADTCVFVLRTLPRDRFAGWACDLESYLLDGDDDGYTRAVELADAYTSGAAVPPVVFGWLDGDPESLQLLDGMHRVAAAAHARLTHITAYEAVPAPPDELA